MAKKNQLVVKTDVGTFTRTTHRSYAFVVVSMGLKHERLEAGRQVRMKQLRADIAKYERALLPGGIEAERAREGWGDWYTTGWVTEMLAKDRAALAEREACGVIATDEGETYGVQGWCGRIDLAIKAASTEQASCYRNVRIYSVASGERVR